MIGLLSNKDKLIERVKREAPPLLEALLAKLAEHAGADPALPYATTIFKANTKRGMRTMVRVSRLDAFGEVGEEFDTIDLVDTLEAIPNDTIKAVLPF